MNDEMIQAAHDMAGTTWLIFSDILKKSGGNIELSLKLVGIVIDKMLTAGNNNNMTIFWDNDKK